jgi:hypothetical protein
MKSYSTIRFRVTDDLSGIKSYTGYIDGKWVLFEYDPKSDLIFYEIDRNRIEEGKMHDLELFITDNKNNMSSKFMQFYY